jgi:predicted acyl esterase
MRSDRIGYLDGVDSTSRRRHLTTIGALIAVIVAALVVGQSVSLTVSGTGTVAGAVTIRGSDGTDISAYVIAPKTDSTSRAPLLIMPASWGATSSEYVQAGQRLAARGYEVISYTQRGFTPSRGLVDFADTPTQADVSAVIDWAVRHADADKNRVGAIGISYGAGISLLAAERDPRIKAVVAMTGWADLGASLDPNRTLNTIAVDGLLQSGSAGGHLDAQLQQVRRSMAQGDNESAEAMLGAPVRSAQTGVAALNRNKTAVMLANGYQDSLIMPNQLITFFTALTSPKRLELRVGDHGGPEATGLQGLPNDVWASGTKWLDHYVRGVANGIQDDQPVRLEDATTNQWHTYKNWAATGRQTRFTLSAPTGTPSTGVVQAGSTPAWSQRITTGVDTLANSGTVQINTPRFVIPAGVPLAQVDRSYALVWTGPPAARATLISGVPRLHLTVTPSATTATYFAYLYDVDPATGGALITYAPETLVGVTPGRPQAVDLDLEAISWTVPPGHQVALVVDTVDGRYASRNAVGAPLSFGSTAGDPATLSLPLD